jgi:hypothetical protein
MTAKAPFVLKFKGNKSFSPFHNLSEGSQLTSLWSVVTKVAPFLVSQASSSSAFQTDLKLTST